MDTMRLDKSSTSPVTEREKKMGFLLRRTCRVDREVLLSFFLRW